jgi:hypothetical protein
MSHNIGNSMKKRIRLKRQEILSLIFAGFPDHCFVPGKYPTHLDTKKSELIRIN